MPLIKNELFLKGSCYRERRVIYENPIKMFNSTVEKDTDETTGREELKVKTLTIHLDDEEEEDPKLKQPGSDSSFFLNTRYLESSYMIIGK